MGSEAKAVSAAAMSPAQQDPAHKPFQTGWCVVGAVTQPVLILIKH